MIIVCTTGVFNICLISTTDYLHCRQNLAWRKQEEQVPNLVNHSCSKDNTAGKKEKETKEATRGNRQNRNAYYSYMVEVL